MSCCTNEWFHSLLLELLASLEENFCLFVYLILCDLFFALFKGLKIILVFEILAVFIITCNILRVEIYLLLPLHKKIWVSFFLFYALLISLEHETLWLDMWPSLSIQVKLCLGFGPGLGKKIIICAYKMSSFCMWSSTFHLFFS